MKVTIRDIIFNDLHIVECKQIVVVQNKIICDSTHFSSSMYRVYEILKENEEDMHLTYFDENLCLSHIHNLSKIRYSNESELEITYIKDYTAYTIIGALVQCFT